MPFGRHPLQLDLAYSARADQRILDACATLTPEELAPDLSNFHRSIIRTLFHSYDGDRFWSQRLYTSTLPPLRSVVETVHPVAPRKRFCKACSIG